MKMFEKFSQLSSFYRLEISYSLAKKGKNKKKKLMSMFQTCE